MKVYSRKLKDGKLHFYKGNKGAKPTKEEVREFIKSNYNLINPELLESPEQRKYLGQVKGGKNKAAKTLTDKKGRFLSAKYEQRLIEKAKDLGFDLDALKEIKHAKYLKEVFKDDPELRKRWDDIVELVPIPSGTTLKSLKIKSTPTVATIYTLFFAMGQKTIKIFTSY